MQDYLKFPIQKPIRASLTKLRISAHPLEIESGRYQKPPKPKDTRFCQTCTTLVENEYHFIYECPVYHTLRLKFYPDFSDINPNESIIDHCRKLLNPDNVVQSRRLCEFLHECFKLRCEVVNIESYIVEILDFISLDVHVCYIIILTTTLYATIYRCSCVLYYNTDYHFICNYI